MNNKFIVQDTTDEIVVGGFGNLEGNLGLLKYSKEEIRKMITENNNGNDNIRLINSLLQSLKELKEQYCERTDCSGRLGNSKKVEELEKENQQLKDNWNKLKQYLLNGVSSNNYIITENSMLYKMQELEKSDSNE